MTNATGLTVKFQVKKLVKLLGMLEVLQAYFFGGKNQNSSVKTNLKEY